MPNFFIKFTEEATKEENMPPRKVSLLADSHYIKLIYSDEKHIQPCTTCSFTAKEDSRQLRPAEARKLKSVVSRRVSKFYYLFDPLVNFLLIHRYALFNKQRKGAGETIPPDHVLVMHLADLPGDAVRPQLRIDKLEPKAIADLNDAERAVLEANLLAPPQKPDEYRISHLVSYKLPEGHIWTTVRTNSYDYNPMIVGRVGNRALMERLIAFSQGINEIARGDRPDLYELIKKQMKNSRKDKEVVSSSSLVEERDTTCLGEESDDENVNFVNKACRRRGSDGNELTAKTCWRE